MNITTIKKKQQKTGIKTASKITVVFDIPETFINILKLETS